MVEQIDLEQKPTQAEDTGKKVGRFVGKAVTGLGRFAVGVFGGLKEGSERQDVVWEPRVNPEYSSTERGRFVPRERVQHIIKEVHVVKHGAPVKYEQVPVEQVPKRVFGGTDFFERARNVEDKISQTSERFGGRKGLFGRRD